MSQHPQGFAIFMGNVPAAMTERSLQKELSPFMYRLNIKDWNCSKPRDRPFGILTFLHRRDGQGFLDQHGQQPLPGAILRGQRPRARLTLLGTQVFCKESDKEPDFMLLRVLENAAEERMRPPENDEKYRSPKNTVFEITGLSCGHYDYQKETLAYTPDIQWRIPRGIAKFAKDTLIVSFPHNLDQIRLEIPYRMTHEVVISSRPPSLFLTLWEPPRIFLETLENEDTTLLLPLRNLSINPPSRLSRHGVRERLSKIPHNYADHGAIVGQSLIYSIVLSGEGFAAKIDQMKKNEYLNITSHNVSITSFDFRYMAEELVDFKSVVEEYSTKLPFDILYQFQALVQNGYLLPYTAKKLLRRLWASKSNDAHTKGEAVGKIQSEPAAFPFSSRAVKKLFSQIPFPGPYTEANMLSEDGIWSLLETNEKEIRQGLTKELFSERARQNLTMVYKIQVTPTRIMFIGPEPEAKNRVLRKFPRHIGYFARVQFCDEDGQDLHYSPKVSLDKIYLRFKTILDGGSLIAGRLYKFLGFSHSSLRSHAVWFMATFVDDNQQLQTYVTVILKLGDFLGIRSPARCAARIGQTFSETPIAIDLQQSNPRILKIPDVKSKDGSRVFSDGVGTISRELWEEIIDTLPQKSRNATCFQIRWAGAKGMLSLDDTLQGNIMCIRESMLKFESPDKQNLEICDVANKPIPLVLNRQMIKILEDMKVPESWFFKAQNQELDRLRKITAITNNTVTFLKRQKTAEQMGFSRFIRRLQKLGFDYKKDVFLCSVVEAVVLREVRLLKHKSRIPIEQGVTLFGIMDEFGFLGDEEVFITFDTINRRSCPDLHNRLVIVTRSPALHPGDIQVRRAVVPPRGHPLCSLSNCIVFSQKGTRDLPSQLSGGDLDGDIYNVIWDPVAVDGCKREFEPADYPRVAPLDIGRSVRAEDMTEFFVKFMATDQLGVIAVKHIILADMHDAGTVHDDCKVLAEMHSTAVDYSKTGIPVNMERMTSLKRSMYRPDFLAPAPPTNIVDKSEIQFELPILPSTDVDEDDDTGPKHKFYKSEKILGKLYRAIDEKKIWKNDIHLEVNRFGNTLWDDILIYIYSQCNAKVGRVNWEGAINDARSIRQAYDDMMWTATIDYSDHSSKAITELEVFTGTIFNKSGIQTRRQRDTSTRLKDEFDRIVKWVESLIRKQDMESSRDSPDDDEDGSLYGFDEKSNIPKMGHTALELSIACLHVGVIGLNRHRARNAGDNFESFKVIAAHCALRELDIAIYERDVSDGAAFVSGGFPGVRSGRHV